MPSQINPESTPVTVTKVSPGVTYKDPVTGEDIPVKPGDVLSPDIKLQLGAEGSLQLQQAGKNFTYQGSDVVSVHDALMQASPSESTDSDRSEAAEASADVSLPQLSQPSESAAQVASPSNTGRLDLPVLVEPSQSEEPQLEATSVSEKVTESLAHSSEAVTTTQPPRVDNTQEAAKYVKEPVPPVVVVVEAPVPVAAPGVPTITSISPDTGIAGDFITSARQFSVQGTGLTGNTVTLQVNDKTVPDSTEVDASGHWKLNLNLSSDEKLELKAFASNEAGDTSAGSESISVLVDSQAPELTLDKEGLTTGASSITLEGTATPNLKFVLTVDGKPYDVTTGKDSQWSKQIDGLQEGEFKVTGLASDTAGNVAKFEDVLKVSLTPEKPEITDIVPDTGADGADFITKSSEYDLQGTGKPGAEVKLYWQKVLDDGTLDSTINEHPAVTFVESSGIWQVEIEESDSYSKIQYTVKLITEDVHESPLSDPQTVTVDRVLPELKSAELIRIKPNPGAEYKLTFNKELTADGTPKVLLGDDGSKTADLKPTDDPRSFTFTYGTTGDEAVPDKIIGFDPNTAQLHDVAGNTLPPTLNAPFTIDNVPESAPPASLDSESPTKEDQLPEKSSEEETTQKEPPVAADTQATDEEPTKTTEPPVADDTQTTEEEPVKTTEPPVAADAQTTDEEPVKTTEPPVAADAQTTDEEPVKTTEPPVAADAQTTDEEPVKTTEPPVAADAQTTDEEPVKTTEPPVAADTQTTDEEPVKTTKPPVAVDAQTTDEEPVKTTEPPVAVDAQTTDEEPVKTTEPPVAADAQTTEEEPAKTTEPPVAADAQTTDEEPVKTTEPPVAADAQTTDEVPAKTTEPPVAVDAQTTDEEPVKTTEPPVTDDTQTTEEEPAKTTEPPVAADTQTTEEEPAKTTEPPVAADAQTTEEEPAKTTEPPVADDTQTTEEEPAKTTEPPVAADTQTTEEEPAKTTEPPVAADAQTTEEEPAKTGEPPLAADAQTTDEEPVKTTEPPVAADAQTTDEEPVKTTEPPVAADAQTTDEEPVKTTEPPVAADAQTTEEEPAKTTEPPVAADAQTTDEEPVKTTEPPVAADAQTTEEEPEKTGEPPVAADAQTTDEEPVKTTEPPVAVDAQTTDEEPVKTTEPPVTDDTQTTEEEPAKTTEPPVAADTQTTEEEPAKTTEPPVAADAQTTEEEPAKTTEPPVADDTQTTEEEPAKTTEPPVAADTQTTEEEPAKTTEPPVAADAQTTEEEPAKTGEPPLAADAQTTDEEPVKTTEPPVAADAQTTDEEPVKTTEPPVAADAQTTDEEPVKTTEPPVAADAQTTEEEPAKTTEPPVTDDTQTTEEEPAKTTEPPVAADAQTTDEEPVKTTEPPVAADAQTTDEEPVKTTEPPVAADAQTTEEEPAKTTEPPVAADAQTTEEEPAKTGEPPVAADAQTTDEEPVKTTEPPVAADAQTTDEEPVKTTEPPVAADAQTTEEEPEKTGEPPVAADAQTTDEEPVKTTEPPVAADAQTTEEEPAKTTEPPVAADAQTTEEEPAKTGEPPVAADAQTTDEEPVKTTEPPVAADAQTTDEEPVKTTEPPVAADTQTTDEEPVKTTEPPVAADTQTTDEEPVKTTEPPVAADAQTTDEVPAKTTEPPVAVDAQTTDEEPVKTTEPPVTDDTQTTEEEPAKTTEPPVAADAQTTDEEPVKTTEPPVAADAQTTDEEPVKTTEPPVAADAQTTEEEPAKTTEPPVAADTQTTEEEPAKTTEPPVTDDTQTTEEEPAKTTEPPVAADAQTTDEEPVKTTEPPVAADAQTTDEEPVKTTEPPVADDTQPTEEEPAKTTEPPVAADTQTTEEEPAKTTEPPVAVDAQTTDEEPVKTTEPPVAADTQTTEEEPAKTTEPPVAADTQATDEESVKSTEPPVVAEAGDTEKVTPVNDTPKAASNTLAVVEESAGTTLGLTAPTDTDSTDLVITVTAVPVIGQVVLADGTTGIAKDQVLTSEELTGLKYNAPEDYTTGDTVGDFTYRVSDGQTDNTGTVAITVTPVNDTPKAASNTLAVVEESVGTTLGLTAPTDTDSTDLVITVTAVPVIGQVVLADGTTGIAKDQVLTSEELTGLKYNAPEDYTTGDTVGDFTYRVSDGQTDNTGTVAITVTAVNDTPKAASNTLAVVEESVGTALGLTAPTDADSTDLVITVTAVPIIGQVVLADGTTGIAKDQVLTSEELTGLKYNAPEDYTTGDTVGDFTYRVSDGQTDNTGTVAITVTPVNDTPKAASNTLAVVEESVGTTLGLTAPTDTDSTDLVITVTAVPVIGQVVLADGTTGIAKDQVLTSEELTGLKYNAPEDYTTGDTVGDFTYRVSDGQTDNTGTVAITVTSINDAPKAASNTLAVVEESVGTTLGLTAPTDADSTDLVITVTAVPVIGQVVLADGTTGIAKDQVLTSEELTGLKYNAPEDYTAGDTVGDFTYRVSDGQTDNTGTVAITVTPVNDAPKAASNTLAVVEESVGTALGLTAPTDADSTDLVITVTAVPIIGQVVLADGTTGIAKDQVLTSEELTGLKYNAPEDYTAGDTVGDFTYRVSDGQTDNTGTVAITVTPVNDAPKAASNTLAVVEESVGTTLGLTAPTDTDSTDLVITVTAVPVIGQVVLADGTTGIAKDQVLTSEELTGLKYNAPEDYTAGDTVGDFTYRVSDGQTDNTGTVAITVTPVNDAPKAASNTLAVVEESVGTTLGLTAPTDTDSTDLVITVTAVPVIGQVVLADGTTGIAKDQVLTSEELTGLKYNAPEDYTTGDTVGDFTYRVSDGQTDNTGTVAITVTAVNDTPKAASNTLAVVEESVGTTLGLTAPTDADSTDLVITVTAVPVIGQVVLADGTTGIAKDQVLTSEELTGLKYNAPEDYTAGDTVGDFTYRVSDGQTDNTGTVAITVTAVNDAPKAASNTLAVVEESVGTTLGLTAPTDADSTDLVITVTAVPVIGQVVLADGTTGIAKDQVLTSEELTGLKYNAPEDYTTGDTVGDFTYRVSDGQTDNTGTVAITVTSINDAPKAASNTLAVVEESVGTTLGLTAPTDTDSTDLVITVTAVPVIGQVVLADGTTGIAKDQVLTSEELTGLKYNAPEDYTTGDTVGDFTYRVSDGQTDNTGTVAITVTAVNDPPTTEDNSVAVNGGGRYAFSDTDFGFSDDDQDSLDHITITSVPDKGSLSLAGETLGIGSQVAASELAAKQLVYVQAEEDMGGVPESFLFTVNDGQIDSTASKTITVITVEKAAKNLAPTGISLSDTSISESVDASDGPVKISDIIIKDEDGIGDHLITLDGRDKDKLEVRDSALYLKKGQTLDFEQSRDLKFSATATDSSDPTLSYTTPKPLKITVDFSYSPDRACAYVGASEGVKIGNGIIAADSADFQMMFMTLPNAPTNWQVFERGPDGSRPDTLLTEATSKADDLGILEYNSSDFGDRDWTLYKSDLQIKNPDTTWSTCGSFDLGIGIPSHAYNFNKALGDGSYLSSTLPLKATVSGDLEQATGFSGKGINFENGHLAVEGLSKSLTHSFSVCYPVKLPTGATSVPGLAGVKNGTKHVELGLIDEAGHVGMKFGDTLVASSVTVNDGGFHHVCLVREYDRGNADKGISKSSTLKVYVDSKLSGSGKLDHAKKAEAEFSSKINKLGLIEGQSDSLSPLGTYDNIRVYPFTLSDEGVGRDYTVDAHVIWDCGSSDTCSAPEDLNFGLMANSLLPALIADSPEQLWVRFESYPDYSMNEDYKFECSYEGEVLKSDDDSGHLFKLNQPTKDALKSLHCGPADTDAELLPYEDEDDFEYIVTFDPDKSHLDTAPAAKLWLDNTNTPLGDQISFHQGKAQLGNTDREADQQDIFLASEETDSIKHFNAAEGDILDLSKHELFKDHTKQDLLDLIDRSKKETIDDKTTKLSINTHGEGDSTPDLTIDFINPPVLNIHLDDLDLSMAISVA